MNEDEKPSFDKLRTMVTVPEVLELLGIEVTSGDKFTSPYNPGERTPSAHAYEDHFFDFSTGKGGDVVDLVQAVQPELTASRVLWLLWNKALKAGKQIGDVEQQKPRVLHNFYEEWMTHDTLSEAQRAKWESALGIPIPGRLCEVDGALWIPHADTSEQSSSLEEVGIYGVKIRSINGQKSALPGSQFTHKLYNREYHRLDHSIAKSAIITEGETDAWAIDHALRLAHRERHGGPGFWYRPEAEIYALPSGASCWKDHWAEDLKRYETIWICMDNDRAGKDARDKIHRKMHWDRTKDLMVPSLYVDAREAIRAGWIPRLS